jgi:REP element-mobilizing transposase RayT
VVAVDVPHHVTQRGNARQCILDSDADRMVYLDLLRRYAQLHELFLGWLLPDVESRPSGGDPSCYRRQPRLAAASARILFEQALQRMRRKYSFYVCGYVVMPQHVHILLSEPERKTLAAALQSIKQKTFRLSPVFISTHQDSVRMRRTDSFV